MIRTIIEPFAFPGTTLFFVTRIVVSSGGGIGLFTCNVSTGAALFDFTCLVFVLLFVSSFDGSWGIGGG